ncbi:uncharacterized protein LOC122799250 [Protopterus annectens]|uniref:uncharacterized protein LOC122799250 n=1 Tax=Protopterus annectens TaxID=7888 RepID=UPI001CF980B4|nr:uncharacterized protein LOC122799250 [Protopterus annectens]
MSDFIIEKNESGSLVNQGGSRKNSNQNDHIPKNDDQQILGELHKLKKSKDFLSSVDQLVIKYRHSNITLKKPQLCVLTLGTLDDTIYWGRPEMMEAWEELYLPETVRMKVIGTIDNIPCLAPGLQLIVLVGEDFCVYIYENEELHRAALSLEDLLTKGATLPGINVYEYGAGLQPETAEECLELMKEAGIEKISADTRAFVNGNADEVFEMLQYLAEL